MLTACWKSCAQMCGVMDKSLCISWKRAILGGWDDIRKSYERGHESLVGASITRAHSEGGVVLPGGGEVRQAQEVGRAFVWSQLLCWSQQ